MLVLVPEPSRALVPCFLRSRSSDSWSVESSLYLGELQLGFCHLPPGVLINTQEVFPGGTKAQVPQVEEKPRRRLCVPGHHEAGNRERESPAWALPSSPATAAARKTGRCHSQLSHLRTPGPQSRPVSQAQPETSLGRPAFLLTKLHATARPVYKGQRVWSSQRWRLEAESGALVSARPLGCATTWGG